VLEPEFIEYLQLLEMRIRDSKSGLVDDEKIVPLTSREAALTETLLGDLEDIGLITESQIVYFEKKFGRSVGKINGYAVSEDQFQVQLVSTVIRAEEGDGLPIIAPADLLRSAKAAIEVYKNAKSPVYERMEVSSPQRDLMETLHISHRAVSHITILLVVDGKCNKQPDFSELISLDEIEVRVEVWDLERLFRASASGMSYESLFIDLQQRVAQPVPCLVGPNISDDHRCYMAVLPGEVLYELYHEFGPRLLELNVRSFLQARGKVNRGIRDTIMNESEYFLPYNNGISATVEEISLFETDQGYAIESMKGLQIVNGGQTVASIHRAKDRDKIDLSNVYVQAKITQIDANALDKLVPFISRYSNTQNKVNETDFSANHPFHVKFQQLSSTVWVPGEVSRWFYERARGQWEVARIREGTTPKRKATFDVKTPRQQKIDKVLLCRASTAWDAKPFVVSLGGQKCFVSFMKEIDARGQSWVPDDDFYKDSVCAVIIIKAAEKIARQLKFSAYRANAVAYTVSLISYRTAGRVDLSKIWTEQSISDSFERTLWSWMPLVHSAIVESAGDRNVTEWCKKRECWAHIQSLDLEFDSDFENELAEGLAMPNVGKFKAKKTSEAKTLSSDERDRQAKVMHITADQWQEIIEWMSSNADYNGFPIQITGTVLGYSAAGWRQVPSPRQTAYLVEYIDAWEIWSRERDEE